MKSSRLDGTIWGWMWMIGWSLIAFGSGLWAVVGVASGEFLRMDLVFAPALVVLGLVMLGARYLLRPKSPMP